MDHPGVALTACGALTVVVHCGVIALEQIL
jgi:hypothetical protein